MGAFKEMLLGESLKEEVAKLEELTGVKPGNGISKSEFIFKFNDGSYIKVDVLRNDKRMPYFDKNAEYINTFTSAKQAHKYLTQANLI